MPSSKTRIQTKHQCSSFWKDRGRDKEGRRRRGKGGGGFCCAGWNVGWKILRGPSPYDVMRNVKHTLSKNGWLWNVKKKQQKKTRRRENNRTCPGIEVLQWECPDPDHHPFQSTTLGHAKRKENAIFQFNAFRGKFCPFPDLQWNQSGVGGRGWGLAKAQRKTDPMIGRLGCFFLFRFSSVIVHSLLFVFRFWLYVQL